MPVCKFYLQGKCKYGDRCYNEHPRGNSNRRQQWDYGGYDEQENGWQGHGNQQHYNQGYDRKGYSNRSSRGHNYYEETNQGYGYQTQNRGNQRGYDKYHWSKDGSTANRFAPLSEEKKPDNDIQAMLSTIQTDVKTWAESKMWPFSCYAYTKGAGCIDGLPDLSPEEMRVLALLHPSEYQNILTEVEGTYCKVKDELFSMSDAVKSNLVSQMNISDTNPSKDLKIAALYGPGFNFKSSFPQSGPELSSASLHPSTPSNMFSNSQQSTSPFHQDSLGASFVSPQPQSSSVQTTVPPVPASTSDKPQNISIFGSQQKQTNVSKNYEVYTPHDSLTESEKKKFEADRFVIGNIPTRPPSEQYCR